MKLVVLNTILVVVLFAGCKKEPKKHYITDQRLRDALNIKKGSYFVYKDSATNGLDTLTAKPSSSFMYEDRAQGLGFFETVQLIIEKGEYQIGFNVGQYISSMNKIRGYIRFDLSKSYSGFVFTELPFTVGKQLNFGNGATYNCSATYTTYHDSINIDGKNYKGVYEVHAKNWNDPNDTIYLYSLFSLTDALLKYSWGNNTEGKTYFLIDSKIIR